MNSTSHGIRSQFRLGNGASVGFREHEGTVSRLDSGVEPGGLGLAGAALADVALELLEATQANEALLAGTALTLTLAERREAMLPDA